MRLRDFINSYALTRAGVDMLSDNYRRFGYRLALIGLLIYCGTNYPAIFKVGQFYWNETGKCLSGKDCVFKESYRQQLRYQERQKELQRRHSGG
jgi:hypothetical protein